MSTKPKSDETADTVGARVDEEFKIKVRMAAAQQNMTMSEYVRGVLEEAVERDL
jgi:predicted HicB family RNase H-like nuclease